MTTATYPGRSGRVWETRPALPRPGQLRPAGSSARATRMVRDTRTDEYGTLRTFANRATRAEAAALLAVGAPVTPALFDVIDHPGLPPALVTAWAPGNGTRPLDVLMELDDLAAMLEQGHRFTPAEALRVLVPLGRALDDMARSGYTPVELSPDHLVFNSGALTLVGLGRHLYIPSTGRMPAPQGMSLSGALLLGDDLPSARGKGRPVAWRETQLRSLLRLAGWMACGLPPAAWGPVRGPADLAGYLGAAGFQQIPSLQPGRLAQSLSAASATEERERALRDIADSRALLIYDDAAQRTEDGRLALNPESLRLGLLHDHGPQVLALAAFEQGRLTSRTASQLSGAGWVVARRKDLIRYAERAAAAAPGARLIIAGRMDGEELRRIEAARGGRAERVDPGDIAGAVPRIAGMPADRLPYVTDRELDDFHQEMLAGQGGQALRRRTFATGWAIRLGGMDTMSPSERGIVLERMPDAFGTNTELLVAVRARQNAPGLRKQNRMLDRARMDRLVIALSGVPASVFRECLMSALLGPSEEDLYDEATRRLLPVAQRLAEVFDPDLPSDADGVPLEDALRTRPGIRRAGLLGRLCTALPALDARRLAGTVAAMDDTVVGVLCDIPAPSLQALAGRMDDPGLLELLRPHLEGPDRDLLTRYTPEMWHLLLDGLRQPEHLSHFGLGWVQITALDQDGAVDARVLLRIAADAGAAAPDAARALLATSPEHWRTVCAHPVLAARWLAEQGDLDFGDIVTAFPDPAAALAELGTDGLRHAHELGLDQRAMRILGAYATGIGRPLDEVLVVFQECRYESEQAAPLDSVAVVEWSRARLATTGLTRVVRGAVERPERVRAWAVNGRRLDRRIAEAVLGTPVRDDEGPGRTLAALAAAPALLPLLAALPGPAERAALLALHATAPDAVLDPRARAELARIVTAPDPARALYTLLGEGLGVPAQEFADRFALSPEQRRALAELTPLTDVLTPSALTTVLTLAVHHGLAVAVTAAVVEQRLPGTADAVSAWGPRWLPPLAGESGRRVLRMLLEQRGPHAGHGERLTPWLLAAGEDGLALVERFGPDALFLVLATDAPPADARLLGELLMLTGPLPDLYRLITANGLPPATWRRAAALLAAGEPGDRVLLRLWSGRGGGARTTTARG
ncbi:hypothetical protein [Streptomyces sp. NPDC057682]|uniref:hypothetical protein n=1 Tax=Streptomyces sp. NPDC057682 TaxID=3346210 RepID=UPI0036A69E9E